MINTFFKQALQVVRLAGGGLEAMINGSHGNDVENGVDHGVDAHSENFSPEISICQASSQLEIVLIQVTCQS